MASSIEIGGRRIQVQDLVNQFEELVGFGITVGDNIIDMMVDAGVMTLFDMGQWMKTHGQYDITTQKFPWSQYGMSPMQYDGTLTDLHSTYERLTGQTAPADVIDRALSQHQGQMTGAAFSNWLMTQENITKQFGWLKYGLDFQQFQTEKLRMRAGFGRELSDSEAALQLQYFHAAQGPNAAVAAQQTFSQQEKKQANVGVQGNVVR